MDDINHAWDVNACPKRPCRNNPATTATGPLLEQLLLASRYSLIKRTVYFLGYILSLGIAAHIDDPARP
jgi:hypothetical protein